MIPTEIKHITGVREYTIPFEKLTIDPETIPAVLGYGDNVPPFIYQTIEDVLSQAAHRCEIQGGTLTPDSFYIDEKNGCCKLGSVVFAPGKIICKQLYRAEFIIILVCTIGQGMENWADQLIREGDGVTGYIVDAVASNIVDSAADFIQQQLGVEYRHRGCNCSNCFSPGYCGWDVSEQHKLFSLLPPHFCGIRLTSNALMIPIKSISGIVGVGAEVHKLDTTCGFCEKLDCLYRKRFESLQD